MYWMKGGAVILGQTLLALMLLGTCLAHSWWCTGLDINDENNNCNGAMKNIISWNGLAFVVQ